MPALSARSRYMLRTPGTGTWVEERRGVDIVDPFPLPARRTGLGDLHHPALPTESPIRFMWLSVLGSLPDYVGVEESPTLVQVVLAP